MRHRKSNRKLGRRSSARRALIRSLVSGLFLANPTEAHGERIQTTPAKAKEARRVAERLITLGKKGTLAARRRALQILPDKRVIRKLFGEIAARYTDRAGGYTRILRLGKRRVGDDAPQCLFELVGVAEQVDKAPKPVVTEEPEEEADTQPAETPEAQAEAED